MTVTCDGGVMPERWTFEGRRGDNVTFRRCVQARVDRDGWVTVLFHVDRPHVPQTASGPADDRRLGILLLGAQVLSAACLP